MKGNILLGLTVIALLAAAFAAPAQAMELSRAAVAPTEGSTAAPAAAPAQDSLTANPWQWVSFTSPVGPVRRGSGAGVT